MIWRITLILWLALLVSIAGVYQLAYSKEVTTYTCVPMTINQGYTLVNQEQFRFLQALFVMQNANPDDFPPGDKAYVERDGDSAHVIFVDGGQVCAVMRVFAIGVTLLDQIGRGETNHVGKPL